MQYVSLKQYYDLFCFNRSNSTNTFQLLSVSDSDKKTKHANELGAADYYLNEEGYIVFTEHYHLKRGYCCQNDCKHCPYHNPKEDSLKN